MLYHQGRKGKNLILTADKFITLDTETSWNHDEENPIGWITSIQVLFDDEYLLFRKPSELIDYLIYIREKFGLCEDKRMIVYIHNASYDLTYLFQWLEEAFGEHSDLIATAPHKIIQVRFDCFVFKCSYRLSNKSLAKWCKDLNTEHKKLVGSYDYQKIIYQDSELLETEKAYDMMDVYALRDCLLKQFEQFCDNVATVPLTSTGYIRRTSRYNAKKDKKNREDFVKSALSVEDYKMHQAIKSGGYTHGNRRYRGKLIDFLLNHGDFRSHYPSQLRCYPFPDGKWFLLAELGDGYTIDDVLRQKNEYAFMVELVIKDMKIKPNITLPFAQSYKFYTSDFRSKDFHILDDNGRILEMEGFAKVVLSGEMLEIISEQYNFDYEILKVKASRLEYIPAFLAQTIDYYFKLKSDLKDIVADCVENYGEFDDRTIDAKINLMKSKNGLNGIFGMCMTDPVRFEYDFNSDLNCWEYERALTDEKIQEQLTKFYKSRNSFLKYSIGVWTTERAKYELYEFIKTIGYENCVYCDTDSIFYKSTPEIEARVEALNEIKRANAEAHGAYIIREDGKKVYYDVFENEAKVEKFKFLHSKCYAMIDTKRHELQCTIAGVTADNGKQGKEKVTREEELGSIDSLDNDFTFKECGGTRAVYTTREKGVEVINGHTLEVGNACIIMGTQKKVGTGFINYTDDDYLYEWGFKEDDENTTI